MCTCVQLMQSVSWTSASVGFLVGKYDVTPSSDIGMWSSVEISVCANMEWECLVLRSLCSSTSGVSFTVTSLALIWFGFNKWRFILGMYNDW